MFRRFFEVYGTLGSSLILSLFSILLSVSLSLLIRVITRTEITLPNLLISSAIPLIIAPPLTYFIGKTMVDQIELRKKLERYATVDQLTGAMNRSKFFDTAAEVLKNASGAEMLGVAVIDIDRFKLINDTFGHLAGDDVLKLLAETIRRHMREGDVFCRFGGDEFVLLSPNTTKKEMETLCHQLLKQIAQLTLGEGDMHTCLSATIGVTAEIPAGSDLNKLIGRADAALLHAKRMGGGRVSTS